MDKIFINGEFMNGPEKLDISFVEVVDGKIASFGDLEGLDEILRKNESAEVIDLENKYVYPGFTDAHMHLIAYSQKKLKEINLSGVKSRSELVEKAKKFIKDNHIKEGQWIIGAGWNQDDFDDGVFPDRLLLDEISKDNPICFTRACYHICAVNSKALEKAGINEKTKTPDGGRIDRDQFEVATGILRENAMELITDVISNDIGEDEMKKMILEGCNDLAKVGVTTVHTDDFPFVENKRLLWKVFSDLAKNDELPIKVVLQLRAASVDEVMFYRELGIKSWDKLNNLVIGPIKIISDGSLGSRTAALEDDYSDEPGNRGLMLLDKDVLDDIILTSFTNGFDMGVHAIGDRSMNVILDIYEKHYNLYKEKGFRPSLIHCQIASDEILSKFKKLDVIANIQPIFQITDWKIAKDRVGGERMKKSYCWRDYIDKGIICVGSSDSPIESFNPMLGIYAAATRKDLFGLPEKGWEADQKISVKEAFEMFTTNAAYLSHEENIKGTIEIGKDADFVVLPKNIFTTPEDEIKDINSEITIVSGSMV
jgi:predicted amidohydrolase YtcJ